MRLLALLLCLYALPAIAAPELSNAPIKWFDADNKHIPEPAEIVENQVWDIADHTLFYQVGKVLDLGWSARRLGNLLRIAPKRQADNVNRLDEVPNSSWYTNRHFLHPMNIGQLTAGPGRTVPAAEGRLEIVAGKFEGGTAGFTVKDATGAYFLLKFDSEGNNEMGSSAEVIATNILHAAGYNVPRNSVFYFHPERLEIGPKAKVPTPDGGKRPMTRQDMQSILDNIIPQSDGRLRCVSSAFLQGKPVGIFDYHGRRADDPNDQVLHQHRRELRALRVIGSWMNDADRRAANTLDMYVDEDGRRYVRHYIIDMGSAFGSNNLMPHMPKYGNEYVWDPRTIALSIASLGFYRKAWEEPLPMPYPSIGYFENQTFRPGKWVPTYPNPAFERCTNRDGYWGAKIVMSFTDEQIGALVGTGRLSNPAAAAELARLLSERRDMIGHYWFARANPIDRFRTDGATLLFDDLAVDGGLVPATEASYRFRRLNAEGKAVGEAKTAATPSLPLDADAGPFQGFEIRSHGPLHDGQSKYVRVYLHRDAPGAYRVVRVDRQE